MQFARRIPFTLTMLIAIACAAVYSGSHVGPTDESMHLQAGYSMRLMVEGEIHRAFTSLFFTAGGWRFYCSMVMFALAVGFVEWSKGTLRATVTFFGIHFATLAVMTLGIVVWDKLNPTLLSDLLCSVRDVGPSAGYYGCLGLALASIDSSKSRVLLYGVILVLVARTVWSFVYLPESGQILSADVAHLIAFPLGLLSSVFFSRSCQRSEGLL